MRTLKPGETLLLATHNAGKVAEFRELLAPFGLKVVSAADLNLPEPEETASDFIGNGEIKALAGAKASGLVALADDSGLVVDALGGDPGIYSARWAGPSKDFAAAMQLIEDKLQAVGAVKAEQRTGRFVAALVLAWPDGFTQSVLGTVEGQIVWPPRGSAGFGYDPCFLPQGHTRTFGEMTSDEKHGLPPLGLGLSHRAKAFVALADQFLTRV